VQPDTDVAALVPDHGVVAVERGRSIWIKHPTSIG
jgi:hypothetical protein